MKKILKTVMIPILLICIVACKKEDVKTITINDSAFELYQTNFNEFDDKKVTEIETYLYQVDEGDYHYLVGTYPSRNLFDHVKEYVHDVQIDLKKNKIDKLYIEDDNILAFTKDTIKEKYENQDIGDHIRFKYTDNIFCIAQYEEDQLIKIHIEYSINPARTYKHIDFIDLSEE